MSFKMNDEIVSLPTEQVENKLIHFWPAERCLHCPRLTTVALLDHAYADSFTPVCALHGFCGPYSTSPSAREIADGRASLERFILWMMSEQGAVLEITAIEPEQVAGFQIDMDPFAFEPIAWSCRWESPTGVQREIQVIWDESEAHFFLFESAALVSDPFSIAPGETDHESIETHLQDLDEQEHRQAEGK
jgi:hypothetical protein